MDNIKEAIKHHQDMLAKEDLPTNLRNIFEKKLALLQAKDTGSPSESTMKYEQKVISEVAKVGKMSDSDAKSFVKKADEKDKVISSGIKSELDAETVAKNLLKKGKQKPAPAKPEIRLMDAYNPTSKSGRALPPMPTQKGDKYWRKWLKEQALIEVKGNDFQTGLINGVNINNWSNADGDMINSLLFG